MFLCFMWIIFLAVEKVIPGRYDFYPCLNLSGNRYCEVSNCQSEDPYPESQTTEPCS